MIFTIMENALRPVATTTVAWYHTQRQILLKGHNNFFLPCYLYLLLFSYSAYKGTTDIQANNTHIFHMINRNYFRASPSPQRDSCLHNHRVLRATGRLVLPISFALIGIFFQTYRHRTISNWTTSKRKKYLSNAFCLKIVF